jgi:hypothetical protein
MPKMMDAQIEDYTSSTLPGESEDNTSEREEYTETKETKETPKRTEVEYKPSYFNDGEEETEDEEETDTEDDETEAKPAKEEKSEEEFDEITYNKEKIKIPVKDRQTYLQKGYNYDKIHGRLTETESRIAEFERLTGLKFDDAIKDIVQQKSQADIEKIMDRDGVSEEDAKRQYMREQKIKEDTAKAEAILREAEISKEKAELKDKQYFKELESEIDELVKSTPGLKVDTAYRYLLGQNFEKLAQEEKSKQQKRTIADIADRSKRSVNTKASEGAAPETELTPGQISMAKAMGLSLSEVAKTVRKMGKR